jgi:Uma2 family endonuclease
VSTLSLPSTLSAGKVRVVTSSPNSEDLYFDNDRLFEIVKGKRVEKEMGLIENMIASFIFERLGPFCRERQLGRCATETLFAIPGSGNDRKPDVAFISYKTWPVDWPFPRVNAWAVAPDVTIEVISPTDKAFDVMEKMQEYFAGGVRQVWLVYSNIQQVWVFDSPTSVRILTRDDELVGDPIVPGFRLQLADLFPAAKPNP